MSEESLQVPRDNAGSDLFGAIALELSRYWREVQSQSERDVLSCPPTEFDRIGHALFANLQTGGVCTLVVTGRRPWDPRGHYYEAGRFAAQRGCKIERMFLLPHRHCRHDRALQEHQRLDEAAGIRTAVVYVGELISTLAIPVAGSLELGLWDDALSCTAIYGQGDAAAGASEWRLSRRAEDLQLVRRIMELLKTRAPTVSLSGPDAESAFDLEEPMVTTAPMAHMLALVACQGNHVSPEDCSWYHGIWQYLRIFDMVSTPTWHASFYLQALGELARTGVYPRVLISGAADYSMLAHVLWAYRRNGGRADITVLDLCDTPLFLSKWYAKTVAATICTSPSDLLRYGDPQPYDAIVTDAFLTRFTRSARPTLVSKWHALLRPGGKVVTTVRIDRGAFGEAVVATPAQADAFRRRAYQEALRWQGFLGILGMGPEEIANEAQRYAERMTSYPVRSEEEVRELFQAAGFVVERLSLAEVPGEMASTTYAEVIVSRSQTHEGLGAREPAMPGGDS